MRIAAIDIGTNSVHMVIVQTAAEGTFEVIDREREVVQIGRGSFEGRCLDRAAMRRTVESVARFVVIARTAEVDRILCTATAAVREAENGGEFIAAVRAACGVTPRVIPGEEEGRLVYLAVRRALQLDAKPSLIVDIGGGSMQLVVGDRERLRLATGAPLGALRLTETMLPSDPPTRQEVQRLKRHVRREAKGPIERVNALRPRRVYGSSGSIHALAQAAHWEEHGEAIEHLNGHVLSRASLEQLTRRLTRMSERERHALHGLDAKRAEIIVPGAIVLAHVLDAVDADGIILSDFGVREGLVSDYIEYHAAEISTLEAVQDVKLRSVVALLKKFRADGKHPPHVARLSLAIYDGLAAAHALPDGARELLHYAALLHDIGAAIAYDGHAEHSRYVIRNGNLRGLTAEQLAIIACVARYHGSRRPRKRDPAIAALSKAQRRTVRWLAAILRIAEGLDRSHYQLVDDLVVRRRGKGWILHATSKRDAQLERWAARQRTDLLSRLLGGPVSIRLDAVARPGEATPGGTRRRPGRSRRSRGAPRLAVVPSAPSAAAAPARPRAARDRASASGRPASRARRAASRSRG
jgi:exopolyphosphatase/guanosine-5'-triphosphate,3'-diphosphate pyrophosphatase